MASGSGRTRSQISADYEDRVRRLVDAFPPLTTEQRARLTILLGSPARNDAVPGLHARDSSKDSTPRKVNHDHDTAA